MKYLICRHGSKITVKRDDKNYDFGSVFAFASRGTYKDALLCAKVERMFIKHLAKKGWCA